MKSIFLFPIIPLLSKNIFLKFSNTFKSRERSIMNSHIFTTHIQWLSRFCKACFGFSFFFPFKMYSVKVACLCLDETIADAWSLQLILKQWTVLWLQTILACLNSENRRSFQGFIQLNLRSPLPWLCSF